VVDVPLIPPPALALGAALAQRALAGPSPSPTRSRAAVTAVVSMTSVALAGAAGRTFRRRGTTLEPMHPDKATVLVTTGSNAISRNPMYVGLTGLLVAHALWHRSWTAVAPVAAFVTVIDRLQIEAEESALLARFGSEYEVYRAATPRWLGARSLGFRRKPSS
jgi:protein-S-isoprenylcysteine O-methyltransferase Ste14